MFKQILGKLPRKSSKSSEHRESGNSVSSSQSSTNFRRGETGGIHSTTAPHTVSSGSSSSFIVRSSHVNKQSLVDTFRQNGNLASSYKIEGLPLLKDTPQPERLVLFVKKLNQCCVLFDFTDPLKHQKEKEIKRQSLIELADYVASSRGIEENLMPEIIRMVSVNIFRTFVSRPCDNRALEAFDVEEEEPSMDPAWPHLQLVYEILLKFLTNSEIDTKLSKRYIDQYFVLKLLDLFDSEDPRERELLKTILHRIYGKFMVHRPFIRKAINNLFYRFIFETGKHNGIAELLEILGSIINGFTLPLKEEHKSFLVRVLIPLHKPKCFSLYQHQLSYCITQFVEKDCKLADTVIRGLLKYWPITNSSKEVMFLGELEEVLEATQLPEFQRCMVPLFLRIAQCLHSSHFQVAERALFLWNNDHIEGLVKQNRKVILPIILPALERNTRYHWNQSVKSLTQNVKKIFSNIDPVLYEQCLEKFEIEEASEKERNSERMAKWEKMEKIASSRTPNTADGLLSYFTGINISRS